MLLEDQDRTRWDHARIAEGRAELARGPGGRARGPYRLQAAIAAEHARAPAWADTDWDRIAALYAALAEVAPSPVVELNRAVAVSFAEGPGAGLGVLDAVAGDPRLARGHQLAATRADLLRRLGRDGEAAAAYRDALTRARTAPERAFLERRLAELSPRKTIGCRTVAVCTRSGGCCWPVRLVFGVRSWGPGGRPVVAGVAIGVACRSAMRMRLYVAPAKRNQARLRCRPR